MDGGSDAPPAMEPSAASERRRTVVEKRRGAVRWRWRRREEIDLDVDDAAGAEAGADAATERERNRRGMARRWVRRAARQVLQIMAAARIVYSGRVRVVGWR